MELIIIDTITHETVTKDINNDVENIVIEEIKNLKNIHKLKNDLLIRVYIPKNLSDSFPNVYWFKDDTDEYMEGIISVDFTTSPLIYCEKSRTTGYISIQIDDIENMFAELFNKMEE